MQVGAHVIMRDLEKLASSWEEDPCFAEFEAMSFEFNREGRGQDEDDEMRENCAFRAGSNSFACEDTKIKACIFLQDASSIARKHFTAIWVGLLLRSCR
jgi:hypothetical protein